MERALFRSVSRELRELRRRPLLRTAIFNGVVRRTRRSEAAADFQAQAVAIDLSGCFRGRTDSSEIEAVLAKLYSGTVQLQLLRASMFGTAPWEDVAFAALRRLGELNVSLASLAEEGAFTPATGSGECRRRGDPVRVGQSHGREREHEGED